jgi:hypothetical protein
MGAYFDGRIISKKCMKHPPRIKYLLPQTVPCIKLKEDQVRVARVFLTQYTKKGQKIPNFH